jgi:cell division protein ZapD
LRIEALVNKLDYFKSLNNDVASYHAILTILEITALVERGDVKQELIKELERQHKVLSGLITNHKVDKSRLELTLSKLKNSLNNMHSMDGKLGEHLKKIDFLLTIKQRASIPGGSCDFDLPQLRYWLNRDFQTRQSDINRWSQPYSQLYEVLDLALNIIRDSAHAEMVTAQHGFFQETLDTSQPNQMIRIELARDSEIFPEISAGKHRYTIRFLQSQQSVDQIPVQYKQDVEFKLFRCSL